MSCSYPPLAARSSFRPSRLRSLLIFFTLGFALSHQLAHADAFDDLRNRRKRMLTGGSTYTLSDTAITARIALIDADANSHSGSMNMASGGVNRTSLWSDVPNNASSSQMTRGYVRLKEMALAYATKNATNWGSSALRQQVLDGLEWMNYNLYNAAATRTGNWWDWRIGSPIEMLDAIVLVYDGSNISSTLMAKYIAAVDSHVDPGASFVATLTGANRSWTARVWALRGVLRKDNVTTPATTLGSVSLAAARDRLSDIFLYTAGDTFHADGSFIQHGFYPYAGGYGVEVLRDVPDLMYLLHGSTWAVTDTNRANMFTAVHNAYAPFIYKGGFMSMVRGREISREFSQDHFKGHEAMACIARLVQLAPLLSTADELPYKRMLKYWMQQDTSYDFITHIDNIDLLLTSLAIRDDVAVTPMAEPVMNKPFPEMDRIVHLRPGFGFGISMFSNRTKNYESTNGENKRAWHTADGMTYLYNADLDHYDDHFWPTINTNRLPGTTVDTNVPALDANHEQFNGSETWVGGAEILGLYGAAGMSLDGMGNLLVKKSWFMFDDEIVALGSGITASGGGVIETIIENRKLADPGTNALTVNGTLKTSPVGWSETMTGVSSIHLAGSSSHPASDIGYFFPTATDVVGFRQNRTGKKWSDIGNGDSVNTHAHHYLTLWQEHTAAPTNATYAYVLLPGKTSAQVTTYAASPNIVVLENSTSAHAVKETTLNLVAVNFWNNASKTVDIITSDRQASVLTKETPGVDIEIAVADPTQSASIVKIEIDRVASGIISNDSRVTVTQLTPKIKLDVDVSCGAQGSDVGNGIRGHTWKVKLSLVPPDTTPPVVALTAPASSAFLRGISVAVSANATDNIGVAGVQFKLDGANLGTEDTSYPYAVTWDTTAAGNGSHALTAVARDAAGNLTTSSAVSVTVDNSAPVAAITAPTAGAFVRGSTVAVSASATDNLGVIGVQFKLDGTNLGTEITTPPYTLTWNTVAATNASHALTAVARDAAGNSTTSSAVNVTVDNSSPSVAFSGLPSGTGLSGPAVSLAATASDNVGVIGVQFQLDGVNLGSEDLSSPYGLTWDSTTVANGGHTLTAITRDAAGNTSATSSAINVFSPGKLATVASSWVNSRFDRQSGSFSVEFDAIPSASNIDSPVGLSNGTALATTDLAAIVRFAPSGNIDARNGATYAAATTVPYSASVSYRVRLVVNVATHTYSAYVTPAGGSEQTLGTNYAFRSEQSAVTQLNNYGVVISSVSGTLEVRNFVTATSAAVTSVWMNNPVEPQASSFTAEFEATPTVNPIDALAGLSNGDATALTSLAAAIRFNTSGTIDARNGGTFAASNTITYSANVRYRFRLVVNIPAHTYSAYVTRPGEAEQTIGANYAFRTEQSSVALLTNLAGYVTTSSSALELRHLSVRDAALSLWLRLDNTTAGMAVDASRQARHGTLVNAPVWTSGVVGDALDLDGTNDHVTLPSGQADLTGGFTVAVLANPATVKSFARFIDFGNGQASDNVIFARGSSTTGDLSFWVYNGSTAGTKVTATNAITLGSAQHFAATIDGSGNVKLYKNGVQVATGTTAVPANVTRSLNYIGRSHWSTDGYYDGTLDELRVFTRVLTAAEVLALKNHIMP